MHQYDVAVFDLAYYRIADFGAILTLPVTGVDAPENDRAAASLLKCIVISSFRWSQIYGRLAGDPNKFVVCAFELLLDLFLGELGQNVVVICVVALLAAELCFALCLVFIPGDPVAYNEESCFLVVLFENVEDLIRVDGRTIVVSQSYHFLGAVYLAAYIAFIVEIVKVVLFVGSAVLEHLAADKAPLGAISIFNDAV